MPRWTSLLALMLCALLGGAAEAWAEGPAGVETHESAPPVSDLPASEAEAEEEEAEQPTVRASTEAVGAVASGSRSAGAESLADTPSTPPPRR